MKVEIWTMDGHSLAIDGLEAVHVKKLLHVMKMAPDAAAAALVVLPHGRTMHHLIRRHITRIDVIE